MTAIDPGIARLTDEQVLAATAEVARLYIEAFPGSGKTTVAAQRFGALRFAPMSPIGAQIDDRSVTAVSFTRSATWELQRRVRQLWGPTAVRWPHRIITLDTLVHDLVLHLLSTGAIIWPGDHRLLEVHDSWTVLAESSWTFRKCVLRLVGAQVTCDLEVAEGRSRVGFASFTQVIAAGRCTHEDVRSVLSQAVAQPAMATLLIERVRTTIKALIVDEVFDANELDIAILKLALDAGISVTMIGDPWQALYAFRGARPDAVPALIKSTNVKSMPLSQSFRWRSDSQLALARDLRNRCGVSLSPRSMSPLSEVDVVLACVWKDLWATGAQVLPLAFGSANGTPPEAAATLLLNHYTRSAFGENATYVGDALTVLRITEREALVALSGEFQAILDILAEPGKPALICAYTRLVKAVKLFSPRAFPNIHANYTKRLDQLRPRLGHAGRLIPGLTIHQAKGREWDCVGVRLTGPERDQLSDGLDPTQEKHRQLYVACTRARTRTEEI
ncbi:UvrD-helicase domain-containing protein [Catellatospora sp. NPDC049111]|uniref:UvrD-helicase domain-containing protein n=1 Tax=Catellatospora sp. NPDC049111 TaxID=3155271 RepID=UPI0033DAC0F5